MVRAGIQLYSFRNVERPLPAILEEVADAGFEGVEFAYRVYDADPDAIERTLDRTGLKAAGAHVGIDRLEEEFEETVGLFERFGCDTLTVPGIDDEYFASMEGIRTAAKRLGSVGAKLTDRDVDLLYHNHAGEFVDVDGQWGYERLFAETDDRVRPQVDVGFLAANGIDPVDLLHRLGDVPQIHIVDIVKDGEEVPLGEGTLDLHSIGTAFEAVGGEWGIYEYEADDPLASLEETAAVLLDL